MSVPSKFVLFECANTDYLIRDVENEKFLNRYEEVELLNDLSEENEQLRQSVNYWQKKYEEGTETFVSEKLNELNNENKRLEKMIWKIQFRFQQEVGIEKAREHYREIDEEMKE